VSAAKSVYTNENIVVDTVVVVATNNNVLPIVSSDKARHTFWKKTETNTETAYETVL